MTEYTKVVIESDRRGRINISCEDDRGYGHGHRLAGPKYAGDDTPPLARVELDERDVAEIRSYLAIWDEIHGKANAALPFTSNDVGKRIRFPHTGSVDVVLAVDEAAETLTFAVPDDHDDNATESFADLVAVDAEVLR
ncbi:hypothetical protein [Amycolatopsis eburnea]|uniref:Uncharacterized protein n=1 Tax=Amycolatopsis eburnea TaxID=2267691 RepID=A0A427TFP2_9PSEU|nr:hypothetical protein [Amycolatopsis eburnea]RSD21982.1 hypothetical protein EIY87_09195 [Amycolatopsis eburnea]